MLTLRTNKNFTNKSLLPLSIALLLFLPTTSLAETHIYALFLPLGLVFYRKRIFGFFQAQQIKNWFANKRRTAWAVSLFVLVNLGILINLIGTKDYLWKLFKTPVPYLPILLIGAFLIARKKVLRYLIYLISFEVLVGVIQYILGINTFDTSSKYYYAFINYDSLYHTRVFGLSDNSSYLAQKALVGALMLLYIKLGFKKKVQWVLFTILVIGVVLTFGRTATVVFIIAVIIYLSQIGIKYVLHRGWNKMFYPLLRASLVVMISFILFFPFWRDQFTRHDLAPRQTELSSQEQGFLNTIGVGNMDMSGRREYWAAAFTFITENPVKGNHSNRYLYHNTVHVHNSFLEFAATNGLILFAMMMLVFILGLNLRNLVLLGLLAIYSFGQFGIFWNISFLDIIFFSLLLFWESYSWKFYAKKQNS